MGTAISFTIEPNTEVVCVLQRNSRNNILNAAAAAVAVNMTNPYVGILAVKLGADNLQLGYLSSWPNLISVVAVLGLAAAVARSAHKQRLIAAIFLVGRAAALGAAAVPWFPEAMRVWALIGFWTLSVFPTSAAGTALQAYLADVFPGSDRARAFATRQSWATGAGMVVVLSTGLLLDNLFPEPLGYQIMFAGSFLFALVEVFFFMRLEEPPKQTGDAGPARLPDPVGLRSYWKVFAHKPFLQFLLVSVPFHFTWQMAWPLFTRYQVTELSITNTWLSIIAVANSLAMVVSFPWWARMAERYGNDRMMFFAAVNLASAPILYAAAPSAPWLTIVNLWTGTGVAGVTLLLLNNQLEVSPAAERPIFLAVHAAAVAVSASIAPMAGAYLLESLPVRPALMVATGFRLFSAVQFYLWAVRVSRGKGIPTGATNTP